LGGCGSGRHSRKRGNGQGEAEGASECLKWLHMVIVPEDLVVYRVGIGFYAREKTDTRKIARSGGSRLTV